MKRPVVLIVDDDDVDRYLVRRTVKDIDPEISFKEIEAGDLFVEVMNDPLKRKKLIGEEHSPMIVLLDINMPRMNGFEVLEALSEILDAESSTIVVTMYSSSSHAQDRADALRYDFVKKYIVKPISPPDLSELLEEVIAKSGEED